MIGTDYQKSVLAARRRARDERRKFQAEMASATIEEKIDRLADALERMWGGGGEYGVYTVAIYRNDMRRMLHEILGARE
ncbi:MAG: hypothetical protein RLW68_00880 [Devosia marina]|uniref:hypothetical protein n=1 Tax=Devosia marina TaxID=2683198 RepID=UPI0032EBEFB9